MLKVENLTFDYPEKRALQHISLTIQRKTITALVGPNGAGKSTLMRCMAALDTPLSGKITLNGLNVLENPKQAHAITGYLPDFFGLYEDLTVEQCLVYHAMAQNIQKSKIPKHVQKIAERFQIDDQLFQIVGTLARGQRQRLAIAQSVIHHPSLLLLDEPAAGLDPEARQHLAMVLVNLAGEGMTIVVSSHILSELQDYCSHMIVIRDGLIMKQCAIDETSKSMMEVYLATAK